jgi:hypothetical protein
MINDDQNWLECSAYGNSSLPTPQFDRVAGSGLNSGSATDMCIVASLSGELPGANKQPN